VTVSSERRAYRKREVVREDIVAAAEELFSVRSPSEVSLREIAARAGVQHSLITRHFGSKDALVREVVERTLDGYVAAVSSCDDAVDGFVRALEHVAAHPASFQAMARALIDEAGDAPRIDPTAGLRIHRDQLGSCADDADDVDPDVLVVALMAFTSGWAFLEDRWLRTAGLGDADRARVRGQIAQLIRRLVGDR
jgi:AcrR family transcriptional regulator